MLDDPNSPLAPAEDLPDIFRKIRARTPARLLVGRAGAAYRTGTQLDLREAHALARDAVRAELATEAAFGAAFVQKWRLFDVQTRASSKDDYLLRPDLGRHFSEASKTKIERRCPPGSDLQIAIGDGLSVPAVAAQVPALLPLLYAGAEARGWTIGATLVVHYCRVGILNEIGDLLAPRVAILLIGERPGLATVDSLSVYMAHRPRAAHSDANRNLISNIHARGLNPQDASTGILTLVTRMMKANTSGLTLPEASSVFERS